MSVQTIAQALSWATEQLAGGDSPSLDAKCLLADLLEQSQTYLFTWPEKTLTPEQWDAFEERIKRRRIGEPVSYITGWRDFWSLRLNVSPATLIPRPETELLVELALEKMTAQTGLLCDLGTGTGAIALSLASEKPDWSVTAVDLVAQAVALAKQNTVNNNLNNVEVVQSAWFDALDGRQFNLIVSNPPYVEPDSPYLNEGDVVFEPSTALTANNQGLADIQHIISRSPSYLLDRGWLMLEHGFEQGEATRQLMTENGFTSVKTLRDLNCLERVTIGQRNTCD